MFEIKKEGHLSVEAKLLYNIWQELKELNQKLSAKETIKEVTKETSKPIANLNKNVGQNKKG